MSRCTKVYVGNSVSELKHLAERLADDETLRQSILERGKKLGRSMFFADLQRTKLLHLPMYLRGPTGLMIWQARCIPEQIPMQFLRSS